MKISLLLFLIPFTVNAGEVLKAKRDPKKDFTEYERRVLKNDDGIHEISLSGSPVRLAKPFPTAALPRATGWKEDVLQERFEYMRDIRFLKDADGNLRRSSWLCSSPIKSVCLRKT